MRPAGRGAAAAAGRRPDRARPTLRGRTRKGGCQVVARRYAGRFPAACPPILRLLPGTTQVATIGSGHPARALRHCCLPDSSPQSRAGSRSVRDAARVSPRPPWTDWRCGGWSEPPAAGVRHQTSATRLRWWLSDVRPEREVRAGDACALVVGIGLKAQHPPGAGGSVTASVPAAFACWGVMYPSSTIASSTAARRARARSGWSSGS